jgi:DNA-binding transcriptional ArsR family regulator
MGDVPMTPAVLEWIADRFKILGDPTRLRLLQVLRDGESTVTELVEATGLGQANVSKHLQMLHSHGYVSRRKEGLYSWYRLADQGVFKLCDLMCGRLERDLAAKNKLLGDAR